MTAPFRVKPLGDQSRATFRCDEPVLDAYLRTQASQDIKRRVANCFVAAEVATERVAAFYTLSAASLAMQELPLEVAKRLPRYPSLPAVRIGRLAVDVSFQGRGLGGALLADAASRTSSSPVAAYTIIVDAKKERSVAFYEHHGFRRLASAERMLTCPWRRLARPCGLAQPDNVRCGPGRLYVADLLRILTVHLRMPCAAKREPPPDQDGRDSEGGLLQPLEVALHVDAQRVLSPASVALDPGFDPCAIPWPRSQLVSSTVAF